MINTIFLPKAYKEVLEIIRHISEEEYNKIPKDIIQSMIQKVDREYEFTITSYEDFKMKELLYETQVILAIFFRDYWATKEQKEKIIRYEKCELERIKKERYNLFKKEEKQTQSLVIITEEKWYTKIMDFFKKIFKK